MNRRSFMLGVAGALAAPALPAAPIANRGMIVDAVVVNGPISFHCIVPDSFGNLTIRPARISDMEVGAICITREGTRIVGT